MIGEKCDQCPHRWVFVPDYGCQICDSCAHALLDDTDYLNTLIDPIIFEFDVSFDLISIIFGGKKTIFIYTVIIVCKFGLFYEKKVGEYAKFIAGTDAEIR